MNCDYCGTQPAAWEVHAELPGKWFTRFVCRAHVDCARGHAEQIGTPTVIEFNRTDPRSAA